MPVINCPITTCAYATDDVEAIIAAAQLNIHALTHQPGARTAVSKQKPPKIDRPTVSRGTTEEEWHTFLKRWDLFKQGTDIAPGQLTTQLWQCCNRDLEEDLFKDIDNVSTLLAAIKRLAVISRATSVRKTELLSLRQDHGQPVRTFAAKVKGKAQICAFTKKCSATGCTQEIDYTDDIVKYVVISGISDEEIKKDILGHADLDTRSLNDTISLIENKEMAARAMSSPITTTDISIAPLHSSKQKQSKELQAKLALKTKCSTCSKQMQRFKVLRGRVKEFSLCIDCWKAKNPKPTSSDETGGLFDVISTVSTKATPDRALRSVLLKCPLRKPYP